MSKETRMTNREKEEKRMGRGMEMEGRRLAYG